MAGTRCDEVDSYKQMGLRQKMRKQFVRRSVRAQTLVHCQRACTDARDFICRSFNYKEEGDRPSQGETFNCELSDRDTRELDLNNPQMFESGSSDFYERSMNSRSNDADCLDVSQVCNEDGMEFTLRTNEPFAGRIYSYGFYDRLGLCRVILCQPAELLLSQVLLPWKRWNRQCSQNQRTTGLPRVRYTTRE